MKRVVLAIVIAACGGDDAAPPVEPPPDPIVPPGLDPSAADVFELDTTTPEMPGVVHGGGELIGRLGGSPGQRSLILTRDGASVTVAEAGWNLPPVAAVDGEQVLVCWNALSGPEPAPGEMPHPSAGVQLLCRHDAGDGLGATFSAAGDSAPSWLKDVTVAGGTFTVTYFRDQSGWLIAPPQAGDGVYARRFDGALGAVELIEAAIQLAP